MRSDLSYLLYEMKGYDSLGKFVLADKLTSLLEKNIRESQNREVLTLDNFIDSLFNFVTRNNMRDSNGAVSFVDAFDRYAFFGANIDGVNINRIPVLLSLRNYVFNNNREFSADELKSILSGSVRGNSVRENNLFVSNSPIEFARKLFLFARNNNFSNLTKALTSYRNNAFYNGVKILNNKPFDDLLSRVQSTPSVITESMVSNELSAILNNNVSNVDNSDMTNEERIKAQQDENNLQTNEAFKDYVKLIPVEPLSGLDSLSNEINNNSILSTEMKQALIRMINTRKMNRR